MQVLEQYHFIRKSKFIRKGKFIINNIIIYYMLLPNLKNTTIDKKLFVYGIYLSYILFFITIIGIYPLDHSYYGILKEAIKYYVSFFLIIKFYPYNKTKLKLDKIDVSIVFHSGIFLLVTTSLISYIESSLSKNLNIHIDIKNL